MNCIHTEVKNKMVFMNKGDTIVLKELEKK